MMEFVLLQESVHALLNTWDTDVKLVSLCCVRQVVIQYSQYLTFYCRPVGRGGSRGFARTPLPGKAKNNYTHDNLASQTPPSSEQKGGSQLTSRNGISSFPCASERSLARYKIYGLWGVKLSIWVLLLPDG